MPPSDLDGDKDEMGLVVNLSSLRDGINSLSQSVLDATAEILRHNGFSTAAFGKYHETAPREVSVSGPFDRWPTRSGFDKFYGFIGGDEPT